MTAIQAERTVITGLLTFTRGLRLSRSPVVAERAAKREQALAAELAALEVADQSELDLNAGDDDLPLAVGFSKQPAPAEGSAK